MRRCWPSCARLSGFGISIILATHLLDDVARVCDHVRDDRGRSALLAGSVRDLLAGTGRITVEVAGGPDPARRLADALHAAGAPVHRVVDDRIVEVDGVDDATLDLIRDAAVAADLSLFSLVAGHHTLDDLFRAEADRP